MEILFVIVFGLIYFLSGLLLFVFNLFLFQKFTPFDITIEVFEVQNKALSHIIKGQIIGQSIMIGMLIYFLGTNYEAGFELTKIAYSLKDIFLFGFFGIFIFQSLLYILAKFTPLTKEIIIDNNESLGRIIEALLIGVAIILSVALYSY